MIRQLNNFIGDGFEWIVDNMGAFLVAVFIGLLGFIVLIGIASDIRESHSPTFELVKNQWTCTSTYEVRRFNGKIWYTVTECSQWSHKESK